MAVFKAVKYSDNLIDWDKFISESLNGTLFHESKFISYHSKEKFNNFFVIIYKNLTPFALFPAAIVEKEDQKILKSHPGTSYGGLVFKSTPKLKEVFDTLNALESFAKQNNIKAIEFRQSPKIFLKCELDQIDFALLHNSYSRIDEELSTCYKLDYYKDKTIDEMLLLFDRTGRNKVRKNVKKSLKNKLEFREFGFDEIQDYYSILCSNLTKHKTNPVHSLEELIKLKTLYPKRVRFFGVYHNNKMIAGYLIFNINSKGNHVFYGSLDYNYQHLRPTSYGLFMLLHTFAQEGLEYLNMGISTEGGGRIINWELFDFKESFNGTGILRTYWKKELK